VPLGCHVDLEFSERVIFDKQAEIARFTVTPWQDDWKVRADPRAGLDPEIAGWSVSPFWGRIPYNERLANLWIAVKSIVIALEYDCTGSSREAEALIDEFRSECDARRKEWKPL
jgi:hypothetical protein